MPSQYSTETKAQVLAALALGEPALHVAQRTGITDRTVRTWAKRFRQVSAEQGDTEILNEDYRLALRYSEILHDAADYIEQDDSGERAFKAMIASNAIRGTAIDKILKRQQLTQPIEHRGPFVIAFIDGRVIANPVLEGSDTQTIDVTATNLDVEQT